MDKPNPEQTPTAFSPQEGGTSPCAWEPAPLSHDQTERSPVPLSSGLRKRFLPGYRWEGVAVQEYKQRGADWAGVIRQGIVGGEGEGAPFHLRYFEIRPGGYSSLERHHHEHLVIGIRGKGQVIVGSTWHELGFLDVLYIPPDLPHQLFNPTEEPFGFFCIVRAERDRPQVLSDEERRRLGIPAPPHLEGLENG
ncbi:MAG: cupin domain-containing protein [Nitrospinota bacterium]|nr:MAG: cupin domain-containing protein [Nitrospinota bacterium]